VKTGVLQRPEGQFLKDIVEGVLKNVKTPLHVSEYPKGLKEKLKDFEDTVLLQQESGKTRVIGIVGFGGVGKTTLAKEFFNSHRSNYSRCCFLFDIRENSLTTLQSYLLKDIAQLNEQIRSTDEGKGKLRRYLSASHSLIILDDVDHIEQLQALLLPARMSLKPIA
jgi:GTPase SAR1 family protein